MSYHSPPIGNNLSWIFWGIDKRFFKDSKNLETILRDGLKEDNLNPLDWHVHHFGKDSYTMLIPLKESHLSIHTYKEYDSMAFGLYSCLGPESGIKTYNKCLQEIKPKHHLMIKHVLPIDHRVLKTFGGLMFNVENR